MRNKVDFNRFGEYSLLHTTKSKMYSGVSVTVLYPIKETEKFFMSIPVWSSYASQFKKKKTDNVLSVNIPIITDSETIEFLENNHWEGYVEKNEEQFNEPVSILKKLFPDKKMRFFYEYETILSFYCNGIFVKYDENGEELPLNESAISNQKYLHTKYQNMKDKFDGVYNEIEEIIDLHSDYYTSYDIAQSIDDTSFAPIIHIIFYV